MNILPKKRWHVRNRDNKERVRKDEENARLEEEKEKERIAFAEQEARTSLLRARSGKNTASIKPAAPEQKDICLYQESGHFNLFALEEQEGESSGKKDNKEYIAEKKAEKEDYEKKIGLLTYLGQSAVESKECMPWYLERRKEVKEKEEAKTKNIIEDQRDKSRKDRLDPIHIVEKNLKKMKKHSEHKKKKKKEKDRKEKSSSSSMAQLREERLKRERAERARAEELLGGGKSQDKDSSEESSRRYNNQFNPHIARNERYRPY